MRSMSLCVFVCLCVPLCAFGQQGGIQGYQNYVQPAPPQVVQQQIVEEPRHIPQEWIANGYKEEVNHSDVHIVRPLQQWEYPQQYAPQVVQPQYYAPQQYYCPQTPCSQQYYYPPCQQRYYPYATGGGYFRWGL